MLKQVLLLGVLLTTSLGDEGQKAPQTRQGRLKYVDPFILLDRHLSHTFASHLWPWTELFKAATSPDWDTSIETVEEGSNNKIYTIKLDSRFFKPEELTVKLKGNNIIVEGKRNESDENLHFMTKQFVQHYRLPPGSKLDKVTAYYKDRVLVVSVPYQEPPKPVEVIVPIEVVTTESKPETSVATESVAEKKPEKTEVKKEEKKDEEKEKITKKPSTAAPTTSKQFEPVTDETVTEHIQQKPTRINKLELSESTTHAGKIRKKELKETKISQANEVTKGMDDNVLDYQLIDAE